MKHKTWRSKKYLAWVKTQPCVITGEPAHDPHHGIGLKLGGMGTKAPDWATMPVTRISHTEIHNTPEMWNQQWEWIHKTLKKAIKDGVLVGDYKLDLTAVNDYRDLVLAYGELIDNGILEVK